MSSEGLLVSAGTETSFTLNLFPDGYSIGKPSEIENAHQDVPKLLHPYDRTLEPLFSVQRTPAPLKKSKPIKNQVIKSRKGWKKMKLAMEGNPAGNGNASAGLNTTSYSKQLKSWSKGC